MNVQHMSRTGKVHSYLAIGAAAMLALFASAELVHAASFSRVHGTPREVPDDGYVGTMAAGTVGKSNINIDDAADGIITDLNVTIAMSHQYIGDLTIKVRSPSGTIVTLLNRPGRAANDDDGTDGGGDSSNLSIDQPITYDDEATSLLPSELMGIFASDTQSVGVAAGSPDSYIPSTDSFSTGLLSAFDGESLAGQWVIAVGDSTPDNLAASQLKSWSIEASTAPVISMPTPSAAMAGVLLLAGVGGIGALRRPHHRRR